MFSLSYSYVGSDFSVIEIIIERETVEGEEEGEEQKVHT